MESGIPGHSEPIQNFLKPFGEVCFGCGQKNRHGLRIQSHWVGDEAVCHWKPKPYHRSGLDFLSGGIIATLIDCHSACAAVVAAYQAEGRALGSAPDIPMLTASLHVDYLRPTPVREAVVLKARIAQLAVRKVVVACSVFSAGMETARGTVVMVRERSN